MTLQLPTLEAPALTGTATLTDRTVTMALRGTADVESKAPLDDFVAALHGEAQRLGITKVIVDFRELEFMNSSSFKAFVTWLSNIQDLPAENQYRIHFVSNPTIHWQKRSLAALSCFATDLVTIDG